VREVMKIIYVYDALCGWCYGFSPVLHQFQEKYKDDVTIEVISGGMITGNKIGPIGEVASYIRWAYKDVENATGVKFGVEFLNKTLSKGEAIFTSLPPAIALCIIKETNPLSSVAFAAELQKAIYYDGMEPENLAAYGAIGAKYGIDQELFIAKMKDPFYRQLAEEDFRKSSSLEVTGFPSVFIEKNGRYFKIGNGYIPFSSLEINYLTIKTK